MECSLIINMLSVKCHLQRSDIAAFHTQGKGNQSDWGNLSILKPDAYSPPRCHRDKAGTALDKWALDERAYCAVIYMGLQIQRNGDLS